MDIQYNITEVGMKGRRPYDTWLSSLTQEERIQKFIDFCKIYDDRQDRLLKEEYQIFSHRLHWDEHPFCEEMKDLTDSRDILWYTLFFSFSNEHWKNLQYLMKNGQDKTREYFETNRHSRSDLFQVWYPKGTIVKDWLVYETKKIADDMAHTLVDLARPYTMMEYAKILETYFNNVCGFKNGSMYPAKNTARYLAMTWPHLVDPDSILVGGTGHFTGLQQIFGGKSLEGKLSYEICYDGSLRAMNDGCREWLTQMDILKKHPELPINKHHWLNIEDKVCFFYKHVAIHAGVKKPTKKVEYSDIFGDHFIL